MRRQSMPRPSKAPEPGRDRTRAVRSTLCALVAAFAACTTFEDPALVVDLRVVGMTATPPEQVLDLDLAEPPDLGELVAQLEVGFACAHVADPGRGRRLRWAMRACAVDNARCDPTRPIVPLADGTIDDPELAPGPVCAPILPDGNLIALLLALLDADPLRGFAGIDYAVELRVGGVDDDPALDQFAIKQLRVSARIPAERVPNRNPSLAELQMSFDEFEGSALALGHCATGPAIRVTPGARLRLFPLENAGAREPYFVPTIEGTFVELEETLTYQWLATAGSFSHHTTGGPRDPFGNVPGIGSSWFAPVVDRPHDVQLWVIQRDERLGAAVYPTCIQVMP
jgi:hypothetical protein